MHNFLFFISKKMIIKSLLGRGPCSEEATLSLPQGLHLLEEEKGKEKLDLMEEIQH